MVVGALEAAADPESRQQLAIPAEAYATTDSGNHDAEDQVTRGGRLVPTAIAAKPSDRNILEVSTVVRDGDKEVVRRQPFAHVKIALATKRVATESYPAFDPLAIFSTDENVQPAANRTGAIYGSDVESEVSLKTIPFPAKDVPFALAGSMALGDV